MQKPEKPQALVALAIASAVVGLLITVIAARSAQPTVAVAAMICATVAVVSLTVLASRPNDRGGTKPSRHAETRQ